MMDALKFAAVSRNYFNMPVWIGVEKGFFRQENIDLAVELHEGVDEVTNRLVDGRVQLAFGITEHVILDSESGGQTEIIGGNVNRLPFSLIAGKQIRGFEDMRGKVVGVSSLAAGSSSLVLRLFEAHGLHHPADYRLVAVGPILARWAMLQSGDIDAGLQGAPLNYIATDAGYQTLAEPRTQFPDFQFTSLHVVSGWAATTTISSSASCGPSCAPTTGSMPTRTARGRSRCVKPASNGITPTGHGTSTWQPRSSRATAMPATPPCRR